MFRPLFASSALFVISAGFIGDVRAQAPPASDMVLWVKADAGVISDENGVTTWEDQSGSGNHATRHVGTMAHATAEFGNGTHDVVRFFKDGFFALNTEPLRLPNLSVYAVVQQASTDFDDRIAYFSNYSNEVSWGYGYHLDMQIEGGTPISRVFTSAGTQPTQSDWTFLGPEPGMHYLTTQIDSVNSKTKTVYSDGELLAGPNDVPGMEYFLEAETASIGTLGQLEHPNFYFAGDIAEILVYSSVDESQRMAVESYLRTKYFAGPGVEGDYNGNGVVDAADYTVWRDTLGSMADLSADGDGDGTIGEGDYDYWKVRLGNGAGSGNAIPGGAAVPEPSSLLLVVSMLFSQFAFYYRRTFKRLMAN